MQNVIIIRSIDFLWSILSVAAESMIKNYVNNLSVVFSNKFHTNPDFCVS
jgi:hypothetical protein